MNANKTGLPEPQEFLCQIKPKVSDFRNTAIMFSSLFRIAGNFLLDFNKKK
jgi:hypothetical protein